MLASWRKVFLAIAAMAAVGAVLGVLIGALTENYLLWIGLMAGTGAVAGIALGYGLLPES
jgi:hypothetical protein